MSNETKITGQAISTLRSNTLTRTGIMNDFDSIRIGIASPKSPKRTDCFAKEYSGPSRTGNATAVNTSVSVTRA